jgi:hypothetical protein
VRTSSASSTTRISLRGFDGKFIRSNVRMAIDGRFRGERPTSATVR